MRFIRKVGDFLLSTYLFITTASACLVLATYILTGQELKITPLTFLVFFSTLLIYNFHKISSLFGERVFSITAFRQRSKKISNQSKIIIALSLIGIGTAAMSVQMKTLISFFPLALLTFAYSVPLFKIKGKKKRLRELLFIKITTLAFVWSFTTVTLPMIDSGIDPLTKSSVVIFLMRFLFMFAICIPFEIRDMDQEKRWGNLTLPLVIGEKGSKLTGMLALLVFVLLVPMDDSKSNFALPLYISALVASVLILLSNKYRSKYYCYFFVDGTMQLQFFLLLLFKGLE